MKISFVLASLLSISAWAAPAQKLPSKKPASASEMTLTAPAATTQSSVSAMPTTRKSWVMEHLSLGALVSQADTLKGADLIQGNPLTASKGVVDINSQTSLGFLAQVTEAQKWNRMGWFAGLSVEQTREFSSVRGTINNQSQTGVFTQKPSFRPWIAQAGANYSFNQNFYAVGGLNYTVYTEKNTGFLNNFEMFPELGYQMGLGLNLKDVSFELLSREVAYNLSMAQFNRNSYTKIEGRTTLSGINLIARYNF